MKITILLVVYQISTGSGYFIGAAIAGLLFVYLGYSLVRPEKF